MPSYPTIYRGVRYRSRLEAKWAAFFDLLGWHHQYEPFDLKGWIPDFLILGHNDVLVEVKPIARIEQFEQPKVLNALVQSDRYGTELLVVGCTTFPSYKSDGMVGPAIGWLGEFFESNASDRMEAYWFAKAILNKNPNWGFFHALASYQDRITGAYDGDHHLMIPPDDEVQLLWAEAGNEVQWKGRNA
jgi:hypothetical protein